MQYLYIATVFAGALVCLLASLLLFLRRNAGGRSRIILSVIVFVSVINYVTRFVDFYDGKVPEFTVSVRVLLMAIFMVISYVMYPIEVILPGWLNLRRIVKLYSPWLILLGVYHITLYAGVVYTPHSSLSEMFIHIERFEVWFRLFLCLLILIPGFFVVVISRRKRYENVDHRWVEKYVAAFFTNIIAYILLLMFNHTIIHTLYYYVSVGCSLYIAYMELFERVTAKPADNGLQEKNTLKAEFEAEEADLPLSCGETENKTRNEILIEKLDSYMKGSRAWRDPDLSLQILSAKLCTNRTSLAKAMRDNGYGNYTYYINRLRIEDCLQQIKHRQSPNFQDIFFEVGFRSRSAALRNFKTYTGMTPSEYFDKNI